jgi:RNA polymerase sigma-70 factor (ECF subfamily)
VQPGSGNVELRSIEESVNAFLTHHEASVIAEPESDEELAARALRDPDAFTMLYRSYAVNVYHYCYRRLESREAAEDATSQIFMNAYSSLHRLGNKPFRPWLFTIAHNVVIDVYRGQTYTTPIDEIVDRQDPGASPESLAIAQERRGAVQLLLSQLPKRDREVVELSLAGLTGPEIARTLKCSHDAVRTAHHRALVRMRALLAAQPGELLTDGSK